MEDLHIGREIVEVGSDEIVEVGSDEEGSGSKHLEESTETQDGRNMADEEEGMIIDTPQMEMTPVIDDDSAPIQTVTPPLFHNPHLDDGLQLEVSTPVTEIVPEPEPQQPEIDLTSFFVTDQVFESREAIIQWCQEVGKKHNSSNKGMDFEALAEGLQAKNVSFPGSLDLMLIETNFCNLQYGERQQTDQQLQSPQQGEDMIAYVESLEAALFLACLRKSCSNRSFSSSFSSKRLQNWKKRCPDKSLFEAEVAREIVNRIQKLTKKAGPEPTDTMEVY
ncbi:hypothetical protein C5167_008119 [Papaver somniferum]|uniref:Uncharacterized protein n=1 Tax=Papaver somniferum TaxID=3469 RepID=A0A4Y7JUP3_PAPSO|nr:hypothetical protein C5167_008119 [Papaver somniferum]